MKPVSSVSHGDEPIAPCFEAFGVLATVAISV